MKINGKVISGPSVSTLVLPRGDDFIVFKFRALTANDNFDKIMPQPKPPEQQRPGGEVFINREDKRYQEAFKDWVSKKINWEFLQSISATDGLEWSTVDMANPDSWKNWNDELNQHFGTVEVNRIFNTYLEANQLDDDKLNEARERFLATQAAQ